MIVHGQGRLIGSLYSSPNPACCYDLWESLSEMERVHYFGFLAGDPNEVANGEVENGSTALRRFFSSKIPINRDNKR